MANLTQSNIRVALYARVSTDEQREGQNIESQLNELRKYAKEKGFEIAKEYTDNGWSGSLLNRPQLDTLRDDSRAGLFQAVIVNDVDRLAREVSHIGIVKRDLEKSDIELIFRKLPAGNSPADALLVNMLGSFAQFERELIADRTRRGRRYKAEVRKLIVGNLPPYGFQYVKKDKEANKEGFYSINEQEGFVVKKMFELVDTKHYSARGLVKWLTDKKISPRKGNDRWARSTVMKILKRTEYIGIAYYNKYEAVEALKPKTEQKYRKQKNGSRRLRGKEEWIAIPVPECKIIDKDRFYRVQEIIKQNKVFSKRNTKAQYLLSGIVHCSCGSPRYGCPHKGATYYRCGNRDRTFPMPKTCSRGLVGGKLLDNLVWHELVTSLKNPALITKQVGLLRKQYESSSKIKATISRAHSDLAKLGVEEDRVFQAYKAGFVDLDKYKAEMETIKYRRNEYQKELNRYSTENILPRVLVRKSANFYSSLIKKRLKILESHFEERQIFLRGVVRRVSLKEDNKILIDCAFASVKSMGDILCPQPFVRGAARHRKNNSCKIASLNSARDDARRNN